MLSDAIPDHSTATAPEIPDHSTATAPERVGKHWKSIVQGFEGLGSQAPAPRSPKTVYEHLDPCLLSDIPKLSLLRSPKRVQTSSRSCKNLQDLTLYVYGFEGSWPAKCQILLYTSIYYAALGCTWAFCHAHLESLLLCHTLSSNITKLIRSLSCLPRNSLMVLSTICASVAPSPNSSDAFFATSLRPTSKASKALVTWQREKFVPRTGSVDYQARASLPKWTAHVASNKVPRVKYHNHVQ